ncbi:MAG TPA: hypothetical protein VHW90_12860 [Stellaceae bacterium]|jgi:N-methylhydantoinase A|nr:hypothetical protein [Stellaceae bacterium]
MARSLEIGAVLVPPSPGVFSAVGLLEAEIEQHLVKTLNLSLDDITAADLETAFAALAEEAREVMRELPAPVISRAVDAKYAGQSYELTVPLPEPNPPPAAIAELFAREHERTYGHRADGDPVQIVNLRVVARVPRGDFPSALSRRAGGVAPRFGGTTRTAYFGQGHGNLATPVIDRFDLGEEPRFGPLLIDEYDATTLVPPGCTAHLDRLGNILIRTEA